MRWWQRWFRRGGAPKQEPPPYWYRLEYTYAEEPMGKPMSWIREKLVEMYEDAGRLDSVSGVRRDDDANASVLAARFLETQFETVTVWTSDSGYFTSTDMSASQYAWQGWKKTTALIFRGEPKPTMDELVKRVATKFAGDDDVKALAARIAEEKK